MLIRCALLCVLAVMPLRLGGSVAAEEPIRDWVPLQGPTITGQLIRCSDNKVYIRGRQGEVHSIPIEQLAEQSRSYLRGPHEPLPYWQTPEETELIARVKQKVERMGIVRVDSSSLKLNSLGLVVGHDGPFSLVLCTSNSENFVYAQALPGSPASQLDDLQFLITHHANGDLQRSEARFHASFPGRLLLKSSFRLGNGEEVVFSDLALTAGQPLCFLNANPKLEPGEFEYKVGTIVSANDPWRASNGIISSYTIHCAEKTLAPGSVALDDLGQVVGVVSKPRFSHLEREVPRPVTSHGYEYLLELIGPMSGSEEPHFAWLIAAPSTEPGKTDVAVFFIDPLSKLKSCQLIIKPFENDFRITSAAVRDGMSLRTLSGGAVFDLMPGAPPEGIKQPIGDVVMAHCAWGRLDRNQFNPDGFVVFHAQIAYQGNDGQPRFSRLFTLNFNADAARIKAEINERNKSLGLSAQ